jgi:hypothetical protein
MESKRYILWHVDPADNGRCWVISVNSNTGMVFAMLSERESCAATKKELAGEVFSLRSVPRLYNEEQLRLRESLETEVRRLGVSCETVAGQ